jgi:hypothetical protein
MEVNNMENETNINIIKKSLAIKGFQVFKGSKKYPKQWARLEINIQNPDINIKTDVNSWAGVPMTTLQMDIDYDNQEQLQAIINWAGDVQKEAKKHLKKVNKKLEQQKKLEEFEVKLMED